MLLAGATARAADLPGPWVEMGSDGGPDVRSVVARGMACPKVVADGTALTSDTRGKVDGDYPVLTWRPCRASVACNHGGRLGGSRSAERYQADRGDRRYRLPLGRQLHPGLQRPGEVAVRDRGPAGGGAPLGPGNPCRRLLLPRNRLPRQQVPAVPAAPMATTGRSGRWTSSTLPRRCSPRRPGSWCAATTKYAAVAAMAGSVCSIRIRPSTNARIRRCRTPCASVR